MARTTEHMSQAQANPTPQTMTIQSNRLAHIPGRRSTWNHSHANTLLPILTLPAAYTKLQPTFSFGLEPKKMVPKKTQKCGNTGSPCLDKPVSGQRVGGGGGRL